MKRILFALALVATSISFGIDFGRVMIVGASNVAGAGGDAPNSFRWPLHQKLLAGNHTKDFVGNIQWGTFDDGVADNQHSGNGGWGMYSLLTGLHANTNADLGRGKFSDWLDAGDPEMVIWLSAANDFWRWGTTYLTNPNAPAEAEAFFRNYYGQALDTTFNRNPNSKFLLLSYSHPEYTDQVSNANRTAMYADHNVLMQTMTAEQRALGRNVTYVDLFSITAGGGFTHDQTHLNAFGANIAADAILDGMIQSHQPVPEPATMTGIALALGAIAARRRRRQA